MQQLWALGSGAGYSGKDQGRAMVHSPFEMFYRVKTALNPLPSADLGGMGEVGRG